MMNAQHAVPASVPAWWEAARRDFEAGVAHAFLFYGNVWDYVEVGDRFLKMDSFLVATLAATRVVATISPERGLLFPLPDQFSRVEAAFRDDVQRQPMLGALVRSASPLASPADLAAVPVMQRIAAAPTLINALLGGALGDQPVAVVIANIDLLRVGDMPGFLAQLVAWGRNTAIGDGEHLLAMTCEVLAAAPDDIRRASSRWKAIPAPLPDEGTRRRFLAYYERVQGRAIPLAPPLTIDIVAQATGGLQLMMLEDVILTAYGKHVAAVTPTVIAAEKARIVAQEYADVLRLHDPRWTLDAVGGYAYLVDFLRRVIVAPWRRGALGVYGLLLSGPPGTGKTFLAEALAGSAGVPLVIFSLARILGHLVGQSEQRMERALAAIMALAPCIVFIDEIDQVVARGGRRGDAGSQVDNRVFARLLTFMEDPARRAAQVLVVAATNRPDLLDPALLSRFERTAPVLPPPTEDRADILRRLAAQANLALTDEAIAQAAAATEGWTGRDLRNLCNVAAEMLTDPDSVSPEAAMEAAIEVYTPPVADIREMTEAALRMVSDLRMLPPEWRARCKRRSPAGEQVQGTTESGAPRAGRRTVGL